MDRIGLRTLEAELRADSAEAGGALAALRSRLEVAGPAGQEAAAFQLVRLYNVVEQMSLRVAKAFENHLDDETGWHAELIKRLSIDIPGVRPPLWPAALGAPLRQLRGFRHVVTHAYDPTLDPARLALVVRDAETVVAALEPACLAFVHQVEAALPADGSG